MSSKYPKWDKNQEGGVRQKRKQTERGRGSIINTRKSCPIIPLYILDTPLHSFLRKKLNYYKIQDYQCTAFNNNVQGCLFLLTVVVILWRQRGAPWWAEARGVGGGEVRQKILLGASLNMFEKSALRLQGTSARLIPRLRRVRREEGVRG